MSATSNGGSMTAYDRPDARATRIALRRRCWRHAGQTASHPGQDAAVGRLCAADTPTPRRRHHPGADSLLRRPAAGGSPVSRPYGVAFYLMLLTGIVGAAGVVAVLLAAAAGLL